MTRKQTLIAGLVLALAVSMTGEPVHPLHSPEGQAARFSEASDLKAL